MTEKMDGMEQGEGSDAQKREFLFQERSNAPVREVIDGMGKLVRFDMQNRRLCHATRRDKKLCMAPAIMGMMVCRMHGGSTKKAKQGAKLRLQELVNPAIAVLAREMASADKSADKQRAANSILDRAGLGRHSKVDVGEAQQALYDKLLAFKERQTEEDEETLANFDTTHPDDLK